MNNASVTGLSYKSIQLSSSGMKVLDGTQGIVEMIVSVYGNKDSYNESMMYGCYAESLQERTPTGLFMHNWEIPVAKTLEAKELKAGNPLLPEEIKKNGGLYIKAQYNLNTQRGKDAFSDIQEGIIQEFSVGYKEIEAQWNEKTGCKDVTKAFLYEWSSVVAGANPATQVISAKALGITKAHEVFARVKAEYLGECAEERMTYAGMCELGYTLLWDLGWQMCYSESMSKADRIAMFIAATQEFGELCAKLMNAMLPESTADGIPEGGMVEMRAEVDAHKHLSLNQTSLRFRDGTSFETALDALSELGNRVKAELSVIGELRAKDRKKEGRMFSSANSDKLSGHAETLLAMGQEIKDMVESAKPKDEVVETINGEEINTTVLTPDFASLVRRSRLLKLHSNV